ncbi:MAG: penicillin-binding protein 2 [Desulfobacteraceae bacterium]|nr:penicillin-binding protein 2 [Desulfobacteraceae bacterium]MCB9494492.1 penicillin-binding protein 2 [Desulfobacteraceae bacterium]
MAVRIDGNPEPEWFRGRLNILLIWISAAFFILGIRLFWLQVIKGENYRKLSVNNSVRIQRIVPARGLIFDRNEKLIVDNRPSFNLKVVPKDVDSIDELLNNLNRIIEIRDGVEKELKNALIYTPFKAVTIADDIDRNIVAKIETNQFFLPGTFISVEPKRDYLYPGTASHIIGYLGEADTDFLRKKNNIPLRVGDYVGKSGIEKKFEDYLRGEYGGAQVEVNARGKIMQVLSEVSSVPGDNLYLTVDLELQKYAVELLGEEAGSVVAMNPNTGEVLCMASTPTFNENLFVTGMTDAQWKELIENPLRPLENKAIQGKYPPGSIFKMIPAAAGLEEELITPDEKYFCSGRYFYGDRFFRCWNKYGHGNINVKEALIESCDVYFYKLGVKLGVDKLAEYSRLFGLGSKTGIEIENEESGIVPDSKWKMQKFGKSWQGGETLSVVIGQGYNLVTPLQMAVMTSVFANGGSLVKPFLVKKIVGSNGVVIKESKGSVKKELGIKKEYLKIINEGLDLVVNSPSGTGFSIKTDKIRIAGKTGTAQVVSSERYKSSKGKKKRWLPHAWFVAFAPVENPKIAVAVLVEHGEHGSATAAPIAKKIVEKYCLGEIE